MPATRLNAIELQPQYRHRQTSAAPPVHSTATHAPAPPQAQIRLPAPILSNKTEAAWMDHAARLHPGCSIRFAPFTLRLPSGCRYTPDVVVITPTGQIIHIYKVKGPHIHDQRSIHAFKEARAAFPFWPFHLVQKTRNGWDQS